MESYYCYDFGSRPYARALLGDKKHWVRGYRAASCRTSSATASPRIAEFLTGPGAAGHRARIRQPDARARLGEREIVDELRVISADGGPGDGVLHLLFTDAAVAAQLPLFGPKHGLVLDSRPGNADQARAASVARVHRRSSCRRSTSRTQHIGNLAFEPEDVFLAATST